MWDGTHGTDRGGGTRGMPVGDGTHGTGPGGGMHGIPAGDGILVLHSGQLTTITFMVTGGIAGTTIATMPFTVQEELAR